MPGYESMLGAKSTQLFTYPKLSDESTIEHPAFRTPSIASTINREQEQVRMPLPRQPTHSSSHGFCEGASQIRDHVQQGLYVMWEPHGSGQRIPYWTCKYCQFRSRAVNADALPKNIYNHGDSRIRYRWIFLAKSHVASNRSE